MKHKTTDMLASSDENNVMVVQWYPKYGYKKLEKRQISRLVMKCLQLFIAHF